MLKWRWPEFWRMRLHSAAGSAARVTVVSAGKNVEAANRLATVPDRSQELANGD